MADSMFERRVRRFARKLDSVRAWLDLHFAKRGSASSESLLVVSLRRYLSHCYRHVQNRDLSPDDIDRWTRKIDQAVYALLKERFE